jgi:transcriptional regulator with XRE-family HTH domain
VTHKVRRSQPKASRKEGGVGAQLRRLRHAKRMSVRHLAAVVDFSPSFISQVENGLSSPSIASLERLASALGVGLHDLFSERKRRNITVVSTQDRPTIVSEWSKARIEALTVASSIAPIDAMLIELDPGGASGKRIHSAVSHRFAFVCQGAVAITVDESVHRLKAGDAITLPAGSMYRWENDSRRLVRMVMVSFRAP